MNAGEGYRGQIPFRPLQLTYAEQERCQELTLQLLDRTLRSYDERDATTTGAPRHTPRHHSNLDSARWKRHKTQENASLYSERDHGGRRDLHMPGDNWQSPAVLLAVGNIQTCLDDVMFGLTTQTFGDMCVRAASTAPHDVSGATLAKLSGPTEEDPFQSLNVMWMVGEQGWPLSMIVRPRLRDLVGIGDHHAREWGSNRDGTVDVYIQLYVETMGHIMDAIVMNAMWIGVLGFWEAPRLSEEKKLQWPP
ncbi:uncharacterized protein IUM83_19836 [Phytophthora cinnamomi]|uniref:uncharacterized protein n=1 Tax=Phytophthora cinnamomi TaxID=4785 RepID=UPI0035596B9A|nr:hypothetical protein IUM83_19836 [Phytophthora cinnamomi]